MTQNEIIHYGVLGQKWGVRRRNKLKSSLNKKKASNDERINIHKRSIAENKKDLKDIRKNGFNSKRISFKEAYNSDRETLEFQKNRKITKSESKALKKSLVDDEVSSLKIGISYSERKINNYLKQNKLYDRALSSLDKNEIDSGKSALKDLKTYNKTGIIIDRDNQDRVTSISANNASKKQIRKMNKIQKKVNRKGDY